MSGISNAFNAKLNKKLGFDPSFDSMRVLLNINRISKFIPNNNVILAKNCYDQLTKIREEIYNYSKGSTQTEYSRCLDMLICKLETNIQICVQNKELYKIEKFSKGIVSIDELAKKDEIDENIQNHKKNHYICELCKIGEIELIDNFKHCNHCCGIYA